MSDDVMQQFEVFTVNDPTSELWHMFLFMILPAAIGTIIVRSIIHAYAQRSERLQRFSTWPVSFMITMLLSVVYVLACLSIEDFVRYGHFGAQDFAASLVFALVFSAPALLILGPLFAVYAVLSRCNISSSLLGTFICIVSAGCLIAEYFWIGYVFR